MLRLVGFFFLLLVLLGLLRRVPLIGGLFDNLIGFWIAAVALAALLAWASRRLLERRSLAGRIRELGRVDNAHNQGKLGSLLVVHRRHRAALEPLAAAVAGEPEVPEWRYRLGCAHLGLGRPREAVEHLREASGIDEEFRYGDVQLRLAEAQDTLGDHEAVLAALDVFDRNHGENAESAYRRGVALRRLGRREEARAQLSRGAGIARTAARYQRGASRVWVLRAFLARLS